MAKGANGSTEAFIQDVLAAYMRGTAHKEVESICAAYLVAQQRTLDARLREVAVESAMDQPDRARITGVEG